MEKKYGLLVFYSILFIIMYTMNSWTPIYIMDDVGYSFVINENGFDINHPVQSIADVVKSMYFHWFLLNGRITTHFFVQCFAGLWGKSILNLFNSFLFCIMIYWILKLIEYKFNNFIVGELFILASFLILMPEFNQTNLWLAGSINYLWSAVFVLFFYYC